MHGPNNVVVPPEGALLGLPARPGTPRRTLMTQGPARRSARPQPGVYSFYAPDFFLDDPSPWLLPEVDDPDWVREVSPADFRPTASPPADPLEWTPPSLPFFEDCFQDLQAEFGAGRLAKAVPVFFERAASSVSPAQAARWIAALLSAPPALTPYGRWSEAGGMLGGSPELLFEVQGGVLRTMALAGTLAAPPAAEERTAESAFLANPKERREHQLVVEGIVESLAAFGPVETGETGVLKLPTLWHLQTPIQVALQAGPDFETLARSLHPTPALGGTPRGACLEWLRRQDRRQGRGNERRGFGAPIGVQCPDGSALCMVAVRNVLWDAETLRIGAGCGIIRESRVEREWEELRQKRASVKQLLGL